MFTTAVARSEVSPAVKASAEALFNDGITLVSAGRFAEGCAKFEGSQALEATLGTELRLADCYERIGRTASAWALFKESQGIAHRNGELQREDVARSRAEALTPRLSFLTIEVEPPPAKGLRVERNEQLVPPASLGAPIPVDPGVQTVVVSAPARRSWSGSVVVPAESGTATLHVPNLAMAPVARVSVPMSPAPAPAPLRVVNTQRTLGIVTTGLGAAGILSGLGLGWYAKHENDLSRTDQYCPVDDHDGCSHAGVSLRNRSRAFAAASTATLLVSGAVLVTGVVLWSTAASSSERASVSRLRFSAEASVCSVDAVLAGAFE
jgi:serine/threonine-protein kinase